MILAYLHDAAEILGPLTTLGTLLVPLVMHGCSRKQKLRRRCMVVLLRSDVVPRAVDARIVRLAYGMARRPGKAKGGTSR